MSIDFKAGGIAYVKGRGCVIFMGEKEFRLPEGGFPLAGPVTPPISAILQGGQQKPDVPAFLLRAGGGAPAHGLTEAIRCVVLHSADMGSPSQALRQLRAIQPKKNEINVETIDVNTMIPVPSRDDLDEAIREARAEQRPMRAADLPSRCKTMLQSTDLKDIGRVVSYTNGHNTSELMELNKQAREILATVLAIHTLEHMTLKGGTSQVRYKMPEARAELKGHNKLPREGHIVTETIEGLVALMAETPESPVIRGGTSGLLLHASEPNDEYGRDWQKEILTEWAKASRGIGQGEARARIVQLFEENNIDFRDAHLILSMPFKKMVAQDAANAVMNAEAGCYIYDAEPLSKDNCIKAGIRSVDKALDALKDSSSEIDVNVRRILSEWKQRNFSIQ